MPRYEAVLSSIRVRFNRRLAMSSVALLALTMSAEVSARVDPVGAWMFDDGPDYPGVTMMEVARAGAGWRGSVTSRWYGRMAMSNVVLKGGTLRFDMRNINDPARPTRRWIARFGAKGGVRLTGGVWHGEIDQHGHRGGRREVARRTFRFSMLPPRGDLSADSLSRTPPMGWSSWNKFADRIDDATIRAMADAMVDSGLRDAGYTYINIDDGWQGTRASDGSLRPNARFPDMRALAAYVHGRGLKLGIYSSPGPRTCAGYEGSYGHVTQDARTFADWGVDYVKYDLCSGEWFYDTAEKVQQAYYAMGAALRATGRPIIFSLCEYGRFDVAQWGRSVGGHLWRTAGDITDDYRTMSDIGFERNSRFPHEGPGGWNDPDMLEIGNGGMSEAEYRTHMALWAMQAAPLIMGHDLRSMSTGTRSLLENAGVIAIDQDPLGDQGRRIRKAGEVEIWRKRLSDGGVALAFFNRSGTQQRADLLTTDSGLVGGVVVRDIHADHDVSDPSKRLLVAPHDVALLRITQARDDERR